MKKTTIIILTLILFFSFFAGQIYAAESLDLRSTGAVVKLPYPMTQKNVSLEKQKVKIIVYSTFIEVDAEYEIKNNEPNDTVVALGFPIYRHSMDVTKGESVPFAFEVRYGKKDDYYIKNKIEGEVDRVDGSYYKDWYIWDVDLKGKGKSRFRTHYYLKLTREDGVPFFRYALSAARAFEGNIRDSLITIDMPFKCKELPFTREKKFVSDTFLYTSPTKPKITGNFLTWSQSDFRPETDLEVYFSNKGFPSWEVKCSEGTGEAPNVSANLLDGNILTYWMTGAGNDGIGTYMQFTPFKQAKDGSRSSFSPLVYQIGIVPGNCTTLSDFYNYTHLREAEAFTYVERKAEPQEKLTEEKNIAKLNTVDRPTGLSVDTVIKVEDDKKRKERSDVIFLDCSADWNLQIFKSQKPIDTTQGPLRILNKSVYPGLHFRQLCISEVLIFDRKPGEPFEEKF